MKREKTGKPCKGCDIMITADSPFDYCGECVNWKELTIYTLPPEMEHIKNPRNQYDIQFWDEKSKKWKDTNHAHWWMILKELTGYANSLSGENDPTKYRYRIKREEIPFPSHDISVTYSEGDRVFFRDTLYELTKCYDIHGESMLMFIPVKDGSPKEGE